ncbi:hypothetical protein [Flavobacterium suncheonense]|uniref:hypothetical protein n=1 Tax=Flavobacterium suncheonense TaxID=350894 RepID=UPI003FA3536F
MNPIVRNILAVITGIIVGSVVNMALISLGHAIIPLPEGADVSTIEKMKESVHLFGSEQFIFPFIAHALGTLAGAFAAAKLAATSKMRIALGIGVYFLIAGIYMCFLMPAPVWFMALDVLVAYIPMAYLGGKLAVGAVKNSAA